MKKEYDYIVSQGHILQLDAPDLAMERSFMFQNQPLQDFLDRIELHIDAMNLALADIPPEKVRLHVCFGNWDGPHIDDVELEPLLPIIYKAKIGALSIACANPRHQHDWKTLKKHPLPDGVILIPGVIDVTTRTPRGGCRPHRIVRRCHGRRPQPRHRGYRLRLLDDCGLYDGRGGRGLGQAESLGGRGPHCHQAVVVTAAGRFASVTERRRNLSHCEIVVCLLHRAQTALVNLESVYRPPAFPAPVP